MVAGKFYLDDSNKSVNFVDKSYYRHDFGWWLVYCIALGLYLLSNIKNPEFYNLV